MIKQNIGVHACSQDGANFIVSLSNGIRDYEVEMDKWKRELAQRGVKGAHPNDGWVNRDENTVIFVYPHFDYGISVGDFIALGDKDEFCIARITEVICSKFFLTTNQKYKFEYVWDFDYDN